MLGVRQVSVTSSFRASIPVVGMEEWKLDVTETIQKFLQQAHSIKMAAQHLAFIIDSISMVAQRLKAWTYNLELTCDCGFEPPRHQRVVPLSKALNPYYYSLPRCINKWVPAFLNAGKATGSL